MFRTYAMQPTPIATGKVHFYENVQYVGTTILPEPEVLAVYPNPSTGIIQLKCKLTGQLNVYNNLGQEVYSQELEQAGDLNLQQLQQGIYFLHIQTEEEPYQQTITIKK